MNTETVRLWHRKAENDYKTGIDELATEEPATDTVCFHMQQCVEKYLKSFLVFHNREMPRTHNLAVILQSCIELDAEFQTLRDQGIDLLTDYAVSLRYPDDFYMPSIEECMSARDLARKARQFVRGKLVFD